MANPTDGGTPPKNTDILPNLSNFPLPAPIDNNSKALDVLTTTIGGGKGPEGQHIIFTSLAGTERPADIVNKGGRVELPTFDVSDFGAPRVVPTIATVTPSATPTTSTEAPTIATATPSATPDAQPNAPSATPTTEPTGNSGKGGAEMWGGKGSQNPGNKPLETPYSEKADTAQFDAKIEAAQNNVARLGENIKTAKLDGKIEAAQKNIKALDAKIKAAKEKEDPAKPAETPPPVATDKAPVTPPIPDKPTPGKTNAVPPATNTPPDARSGDAAPQSAPPKVDKAPKDGSGKSVNRGYISYQGDGVPMRPDKNQNTQGYINQNYANSSESTDPITRGGNSGNGYSVEQDDSSEPVSRY